MRLIGLVVTALIFVIFIAFSLGAVTNQLKFVNKQGKFLPGQTGTNNTAAENPTQAALSLAEQANLLNVRTALEAYLSENDSFPDSLNQTDPGFDTSNYSYNRCNNFEVIVKAPSGGGLKIDSGHSTYFSKDNPASC